MEFSERIQLSPASFRAVAVSPYRHGLQAERTTIIIRDLPAGSTEEELWAFFETNGLVKPQSISTVVNNWFVTMPDQDATTSTFLKLRSLTFKGESIKARVKSEHVLRGGGPSNGKQWHVAVRLFGKLPRLLLSLPPPPLPSVLS